LEKKKKAKNELTVSEFLLIEKYRFQKMNVSEKFFLIEHSFYGSFILIII